MFHPLAYLSVVCSNPHTLPACCLQHQPLSLPIFCSTPHTFPACCLFVAPATQPQTFCRTPHTLPACCLFVASSTQPPTFCSAPRFLPAFAVIAWLPQHKCIANCYKRCCQCPGQAADRTCLWSLKQRFPHLQYRGLARTVYVL